MCSLHDCSFLYWNDQGSRMIERARLDGSGRQVVLAQTERVQWPNHMIINDE